MNFINLIAVPFIKFSNIWYNNGNNLFVFQVSISVIRLSYEKVSLSEYLVRIAI